jgi:polyisoprenoid-binding protein YceI
VLLLASLVSAPLAAQGPIPSGSIEHGVLAFDGHATTGSFTGTTETVVGEMSGGASLAEVRGWVEAPVVTLVTGNNKRDKDLNKSMESDKYPTIRYDLSGVEPGRVHGDTVDVTLRGTFHIHGVSREAAIPAMVVVLPGSVSVHATTPMNLKDYAIGGLTKALGILRMQEVIEVHLDLVFAGSLSQAAPS